MLLGTEDEEGLLLVETSSIDSSDATFPVGLFPYGNEDTNKLQCFQSLEHLTLFWRARAHVASLLLLGHLLSEGSKQVALQGPAPGLNKTQIQVPPCLLLCNFQAH